ncbi:rhodanese-like domain-containing protein [Dermatophilus congolensis]|uniref:rhodanese-like domain-containing protein n=1 Tax=Dermatophilus congolensis TaxID=1863 RepID=UPI001AAE7466|nr:rhodanese-like domain-containing protein [Dermatophilus congolensis]MBO3142626.1 rhodanese-like domain-containing protein [Dermatophilus congolensis]MBO3151617.1 rhodanese-like domain-containing protein [Dermatophilus congolensis]MBO3161383.1 rhodanese-like domain-containing protein [Dermatophilus congolensis]MBO3162899.1 rhodanese-like domain-containing protein [Dermatophilus congolensis]MBO3176452.1 rhodanese-like domain-containing protein [Dermatophilus congolensis]
MTRSEHITAAQAHAWIHSPDAPTLLDVRTPAEFASTHIARSINAPIDLIEKDAARIGAAIPNDVLLICRTDNRAHAAAKALAPTMGGKIHVLVGGMTQWEKEHRPVENGKGGPWAMDRQVRTVAGVLALSSIAASTIAPKAKWLAGGIGAGLLYAGLSDTCAMAKLLDKMPWNQVNNTPTTETIITTLSQKKN